MKVSHHINDNLMVTHFLVVEFSMKWGSDPITEMLQSKRQIPAYRDNRFCAILEKTSIFFEEDNYHGSDYTRSKASSLD